MGLVTAILITMLACDKWHFIVTTSLPVQFLRRTQYLVDQWCILQDVVVTFILSSGFLWCVFYFREYISLLCSIWSNNICHEIIVLWLKFPLLDYLFLEQNFEERGESPDTCKINYCLSNLKFCLNLTEPDIPVRLILLTNLFAYLF